MKKVNEEEKLKPICPDCIKTAVTLIMNLDDDWKEKIKKIKKEIHSAMDNEGYIDCMVCWNIIDEIAE